MRTTNNEQRSATNSRSPAAPRPAPRLASCKTVTAHRTPRRSARPHRTRASAQARHTCTPSDPRDRQPPPRGGGDGCAQADLRTTAIPAAARARVSRLAPSPACADPPPSPPKPLRGPRAFSSRLPPRERSLVAHDLHDGRLEQHVEEERAGQVEAWSVQEGRWHTLLLPAATCEHMTRGGVGHISACRGAPRREMR